MRFFSFSIGVPKCQIFVSEILPKTRFWPFGDLRPWPKSLKIILHNEDSTSNMYVKFQNNQIQTVVCRARSELRTEPQTDRQTDNVNKRINKCKSLRDVGLFFSLFFFFLNILFTCMALLHLPLDPRTRIQIYTSYNFTYMYLQIYTPYQPPLPNPLPNPLPPFPQHYFKLY